MNREHIPGDIPYSLRIALLERYVPKERYYPGNPPLKPVTKIPSGYCQCGCGRKTRLLRYDNKKQGIAKGEHSRFISGHNLKKGIEHPKYNGGLTYNKARNRWYVVLRNERPIAFSRAIMEGILGRPLLSSEIVHHNNGTPLDDRPKNLTVCQGIKEHCAIAHYGYSKEKMLLMLRQLAQRKGRIPTREEIDKEPNMPNGKTYYNRFGGFRKALEEAGLACPS